MNKTADRTTRTWTRLMFVLTVMALIGSAVTVMTGARVASATTQPAPEAATTASDTPAPDPAPAPAETPAPDPAPAPAETPAPDPAPAPAETPAPDPDPAPASTGSGSANSSSSPSPAAAEEPAQLPTDPSSARPDITKELDSVQDTGFTAPNTFETGALVRYRIKVSCLTNDWPCYSATVTDVLDPGLSFVEVRLPTTDKVQLSAAHVGNTVTVEVGDANGTDATRFDGGDSVEFVIVARVDGDFPGGTIPNQANITITNGSAKDSEIVTINVPTPDPQYGVTKYKSSPAGNPAVGGEVSYVVAPTFPSRLGNVAVTGGTLTDTVPAGAVIVDAAGGTVSANSDGTQTITWTIEPFDPAVGNWAASANGYLGVYRTITLKFPSPEFAAGDQPVNKVDLTLTFAGHPDGHYTDSETVTLGEPVITNTFDKTGPAEIGLGQVGEWQVRFQNTGNIDMTNVVIQDRVPDQYSAIEFFQRFPGLDLGGSATNPVKAQSSADGNTWTDVFTDVGGYWGDNIGARTNTYPVPAGHQYIRAVYPAIKPGQVVNLRFRAAAPTDGTLLGSVVTNCASIVADQLELMTSCADSTLVNSYAKFTPAKTHRFADAQATGVSPNETFKWTIGAVQTDGTLETSLRLSDVLPKEFEFVGVACAGIGGTGSGIRTALDMVSSQLCTPAHIAPVGTPVVEPLADGSTRVTFEFDPSTLSGYSGASWAIRSSAAAVTMWVRVKPGTAVGAYTNSMQVQSLTRETKCEPATTAVTGADGQPACQATDRVIVDQAGVLEGTKWDDGYPGLPHVLASTGQPSTNCPDWGGYTRFPCVAQTIPDGSFSYRWNLANAGNIDLTDYVFYDVLPHAGDTGVSQTLSGSPRGTDWSSVTLTGPVQVLGAPAGANVVIEYNQSYNPCRPEVASGATDTNWQGSCDNNWSSSYVGAKSFRVKAFQPVNGTSPAWPVGTSIQLQAPMQAPADAGVSQPGDLSIAWNSFAHRAHRLNGDGSVARLLAAEPEKVGIIIPFDFYRLGNQLWLDDGAAAGHTDNGVYDTDEVPIGGATVELWQDNGDGSFDPGTDKKIDTTTTDADGNYWFSISRDTPYFVAIPSGQTGQTAAITAIDLADYVSSTGQTTGDNKDNGAPAAGYAAVSGVVTVTDGQAPTGEQDTNDTVSAETEANASSTGAVDDANSNLTIDFGFVRDGYYDLALVKVVDNASPVQPSDTIAWTVRVRNQGTLPSGAVTVVDNIPIGLTYVAGSCAGAASCSESNGVITWNITDLAAATDLDLTFKTTIADVTKAPFRNWAEIASDSGDDKDSTPNGAETNGTVGQDQTLPNDKYVGIDALADATIDQVTGDEDDNDDATVDVNLVYDLALAKVTSSTSVAPGGHVTWTIRVQNQGNLASGVYTVTDTIPTGMKFVSCAGATACAETTAGSGVVTYTMPNLAPGAFADVTLVTEVTDITKRPFRNWAEISADSADSLYGLTDKDSTPDTNTGQDSTLPNDSYVSVTDLATIATDGQPANDEDDNDDAQVGGSVTYDLALVKVVDNTSPVQPTDTITWTVRVRNQGNVPSKAFTVTDNIPTGLTYVAASCTGGASCSVTGTQVTWNVTDLAVGAELDLTYQATISDLNKAPYRNWAEITADSAQSVYGTADEDSTPDTDIGQDATLPNDDYVGIDDLSDVTIDQVTGDEDDNDDASVDVTIVYDLALAKVTTASSVNVDDEVTWTIRVQNQGNVASGVYTVTDTIPSGMTFVSCAGATSCANAAGVVTYTMPTLAAGSFADITLVTKVADMNKQPFRNWAEISADGADGYDIAGVRDVEDKDSTPDTNTGHDATLPNDTYVSVTDLATIATDGQPANDEDDNDDATVSGVVHYDLALIKTTEATSITYGNEVTWTITVKNQGNVDSGLYDVTDTLPSGMEFVSATPAGVEAGGVVTWADQPNLAAGATTTFTLVTKAVDMGKRPFRNWAEISKDSGDDEDSTPDTNTGKDQTLPNDLVDNHNDISIDQPANDEDDNDFEEVPGDVVYDLALVKVVDNASPVSPTDTITWTVRVRNQGNVPSGEYTVTDTIPAGLAYGSCTGGVSCTQAAGVVTWTMPNLEPGAEADVTYTTTISDLTKRPFRNWAEISADSAQDLYGTEQVPVTDKDSTPDTDTGSGDTLPNDNYVGIDDLADASIDQVEGDEDDNDDAIVDVTVNYDLALAKITGQSVVEPSDEVTWTIRVQNQGNVPSGSFTVTDTLPTGMEFVSASNGGTASGRTVTWVIPAGDELAVGGFVDLTVVTKVSDPTERVFRNWAEISADSAATYSSATETVTDDDSTPDTNTGADQVLPNDDYIGIDDLGVIATDNIPEGDEDDNDDAVVDINARYDLALIKTVQPGSFEPGDNATFTITVANQGNVPSREFTVLDQLPGGLTFVSASDDGTHAAGLVTWTIADLAPGATKQLTVTVTITDPTLRKYRNWAEISADSSDLYSIPDAPVTDEDSTPDTDTGTDPGQGLGTGPNDEVVNHNDITQDNVEGDEDDNDYEDLDVVVRYDLALAKIVTTKGPVNPGATVTWAIRVRNQGNVASGVFDVTDTLPTGFSFVAASNGGTATGRTVTWNDLPSLAPGGSITLTLTTKVTAQEVGSYRNWAEISADSSLIYGPDILDKDSTPDTTTGSDETLPNDAYVGIDDLGLIDTDGQPVGDEDDNDDAIIKVVQPTGVLPNDGGLPATGSDSSGLLAWAGLLTAAGAGLWLVTRRRRRPASEV